MIVQKKWIDIVEQKSTGKTKVFTVVSKEEDMLGRIKWFGRWRKYAFFPENGTIYETDCLEDIASFLRDLMTERRKQKQVSEMRNIKLYEEFGLDKIDKLDARIKQLEDRGFSHVRTRLRNDEVMQSLLYHQIEEPNDEEWTEFIEELDDKLK